MEDAVVSAKGVMLRFYLHRSTSVLVFFVLFVQFLWFRFDPFTKFAQVTGMARTEAVCEVFFVYLN